MCGLLKPDAAGGAPILAGHELSNDLRALRLVHHGRVIDTAVLFPQQSLESLVRTQTHRPYAVFGGSSHF
eukprot:COSAG04_NODE_652_length_11552_cov_10.246136_8_plen_70_part_00